MNLKKLLIALAAGLAMFLLARSWQRPPGPTRAWELPAAMLEEDAARLGRRMERLPTLPGRADRPDIVVIVLDTVRADHLGMYGYDGRTTPRLDAWAKEARIYDRMIASAPWTLPSHASLFTGRYPIEHGAHGTPPDSSAPAAMLAPGLPTVAEALQRVGYRTAAIAANRAFLQRSFGLDRGFDLYLCEELGTSVGGVPYVTADRMLPLATRWLSRREGDDPVFLFLNFMDAHSPWVPREGYVAHPERIDPTLLPDAGGWSGIESRLYAVGELPDGAPATWSEAYDSELRFLDEHVGKLLEQLPDLGIGPEDTVFVLADHGEYLGEHGLVEHSKDVYQQVLWVPLLVKGPNYSIGRDDRPIQHHDVATMILAAAGLGPLAGYLPTTDLQVSELYWTRRKDLHQAVYGERFKRIRRAYLSGGRKLILGSDGTVEAYDLLRDPLESRSVRGADWVEGLREAGETWLEGRVEAPMVLPGGGTDVGALRELGYVQ